MPVWKMESLSRRIVDLRHAILFRCWSSWLKGHLVSGNKNKCIAILPSGPRWLFVTIMRSGVTFGHSKHCKKSYQRLHQVQKSTCSTVYATDGTLTWRTDDTGQTAFLGPLTVNAGRKHLKRYGCLLPCLTTRAVHLEAAHSLTADSFIAAFQRYTSRRGIPEKVFSDNWTSLIKGDKELRKSL